MATFEYRLSLQSWPVVAVALDSKWRSQPADAPERFQKVGNVRIAWRKAQRGHAARPHQLGWDEKQPLPQALQRGSLQMSWHTEPLEPVQQIVGQQDDREEGLVCQEVLCRDLAQSVGVFQFSDDQLRAGPLDRA